MKTKPENRKPLKRLVIIGLVVTLCGSMLAANASNTVHPQAIDISAPYVNAPPEVPIRFASVSTKATLSNDSMVKAMTSGVGLEIYRYVDGEEFFKIEPTDACPKVGSSTTSAGVPVVSGDGSRIAFSSSESYMHCLAGLPSPPAGSRSVWAMSHNKESRSWELELVDVDPSGGLSRPALTYDGNEVFFPSSGVPAGLDMVASGRQIYSKNLETGTSRIISQHFKLNPANRPGQTTVDGAIFASADGRYVGWEEPNAFRSSKMRSDEIQRSVQNIVVMETKNSAGVNLNPKDYSVITVPTASPEIAQDSNKRVGFLLSIVSNDDGLKIYYNTEGNQSSAQYLPTHKTFVYDFSQRKLYSLGVRLMAVSNEGHHGISNRRTYNLGESPGSSPVIYKELTYSLTSSSSLSDYGYYFVNGTRGVHANSGSDPAAFEVPVP